MAGQKLIIEEKNPWRGMEVGKRYLTAHRGTAKPRTTLWKEETTEIPFSGDWLSTQRGPELRRDIVPLQPLLGPMGRDPLYEADWQPPPLGKDGAMRKKEVRRKIFEKNQKGLLPLKQGPIVRPRNGLFVGGVWCLLSGPSFALPVRPTKNSAINTC